MAESESVGWLSAETKNEITDMETEIKFETADEYIVSDLSGLDGMYLLNVMFKLLKYI